MNQTSNELQLRPNTSEVDQLVLSFTAKQVPAFSQFLGQGFYVTACTGISIKEFFTQQLEMNPQYLEDRVQTILLDGQPVDDTDSAKVINGSVLALSAALPGVLGATLRKGGYYAAMRSHITYTSNLACEQDQQGWVIIKLFNLIAKELGPLFLARGILIQATELADFLQRQGSVFWRLCREATLNGQSQTAQNLTDIQWPADRLVHLQIQTT